jgi:hypothetical protein
MTLFEILSFNKEIISKLLKAGVKPDDYHYINLYNDYMRMLNQGEKVTYIVATLSERYSVSERKIYSIIRRFKTQCTSYAV